MPSNNKKSIKKDIKKIKKLVKKSSTRAMRPMKAGVRKMRGRGGFFSDVKDFFSKKFEGTDQTIGNMGLSTLGSGIAASFGIPPELGREAGSLLSRVLGLGSYHISRNSLMENGGGAVETTPCVARPPSFGSTGTGSDIIFSHSEFVTDIVSSTSFSVQQFINNPGNPILMPWAYQIAQLYEEFEFLGLLYEWRPTSATAVGTTNSAMGVVIIATEYDVYDAGYTSKRQMEASEFSSSAVPYQRFLHPIECDPKRNVLPRCFVAPGATNTNNLPGDDRFYVPSVTSVATQGQQTSGQIIGELWVTYQMRLSRPILENLSGTNFSQHIVLGSTAAGVPSIIANQAYAGQAFTAAVSGTTTNQVLTLAVSSVAGNYAPLGRFLISITYTPNNNATTAAWISPTQSLIGTAGNVTFPFLQSRNGIQDVTLLADGGAGNNLFYLDGGGTAGASGTTICQFNTVADILQFPLLSSTTYASTMDVFIVPVNTLISAKRPSDLRMEERIRSEVQKRFANLNVRTEFDDDVDECGEHINASECLQVKEPDETQCPPVYTKPATSVKTTPRPR